MDPPGVAARRAAVAAVHAVTAQGRPLDSALDRATATFPYAPDKGHARALAYAALRRLPDLDALIDGATAQALPPDARARQVLRVALAGALVLGAPGHAVVSTALPLVEGGPRRLVHGVLGRLLREAAALPEVPTLPEPFASRWTAAWGAEGAANLARGLAQPAPLDLCLRDPAATEAFAARVAGTSLMPGHVRLEDAGDVRAIDGYAAGDWWVQDVAAQLPARLLGDVAGKRVLDLCAAPGGKTMQLASMGADVTALDMSAKRLVRLRENLQRTGLKANIVRADALEWGPREGFDAVLIDAPCSATGIFRRHPDTLHLTELKALPDLAATQRALLARAAGWLKPGGRLVYAVCSLEPEEGEAVVEGCALTPDPLTTEALPVGIVPDAGGRIRIGPATDVPGGADGFFIARFRR